MGELNRSRSLLKPTLRSFYRGCWLHRLLAVKLMHQYMQT